MLDDFLRLRHVIGSFVGDIPNDAKFVNGVTLYNLRNCLFKRIDQNCRSMSAL